METLRPVLMLTWEAGSKMAKIRQKLDHLLHPDGEHKSSAEEAQSKKIKPKSDSEKDAAKDYSQHKKFSKFQKGNK